MSEDGTLVKAEKKQSVRYLNHAVLKKMSRSEDYHMETEEKEIDFKMCSLKWCWVFWTCFSNVRRKETFILSGKESIGSP